MPRSRSIAGSATLTTVASRKTTVEARIVAMRVSRSLRVIPTSVSSAPTTLVGQPHAGGPETARAGRLLPLADQVLAIGFHRKVGRRLGDEEPEAAVEIDPQVRQGDHLVHAGPSDRSRQATRL